MAWFMWWEEQNVIFSGIAFVILWFVAKGLFKKKTPTNTAPKVDDNF